MQVASLVVMEDVSGLTGKLSLPPFVDSGISLLVSGSSSLTLVGGSCSCHPLFEDDRGQRGVGGQRLVLELLSLAGGTQGSSLSASEISSSPTLVSGSDSCSPLLGDDHGLLGEGGWKLVPKLPAPAGGAHESSSKLIGVLGSRDLIRLG